MGGDLLPVYNPKHLPNTHTRARKHPQTHSLAEPSRPPGPIAWRSSAAPPRAREGFSVTGGKTKKILAGHVEKRKRENWG